MSVSRYACLAVLLASSAVARGELRVWHVKQDGTGDFTAIQPAMDAANPGDIVTVHPGTYLENLRFNGKDIVLKGTKPWDRHTVFETTITGVWSTGENQWHEGPVLDFAGTESDRCAVLGVRVFNNSQTAGEGRGDMAGEGRSAAAFIGFNRFERCGGFVGALRDLDGWIIRNDFIQNTGRQGGALSGCDGIIGANLFSGNRVRMWDGPPEGGAIYSSHALILANQFMLNTADAYDLQNVSCYYSTCSGFVGVIYAHGGAVSQASLLVANNIFIGQIGRGSDNRDCRPVYAGIVGCYVDRWTAGSVVAYASGAEFLNNTFLNDDLVDAASWEPPGLFQICPGGFRNNIIWDQRGSKRVPIASDSDVRFRYTMTYEQVPNSTNCVVANPVFISDTYGGPFTAKQVVADLAGERYQVSFSQVSWVPGQFKDRAAVLLEWSQLPPAAATMRAYAIVDNTADSLLILPSSPISDALPDLWNFYTLVDFHLSPESPAIDAGDPDPVYNDIATPPGQGTARNDMGAFGGVFNEVWQPKEVDYMQGIGRFLVDLPPFIPEDTNEDGVFDVADLPFMWRAAEGTY
ncbi:hypothetical protein HZA57_06055 [Candidatus Poribacteria bacterium]|nr:hypothetical protein [Candidatus Poribacteria bacterium]